ncbi:hypothetical protein ACOSQ3_014338 [Xanthoceras sorbifolium]
MIGLNQNEASVEDPIVVDNQIKAIDHSPDPIQIKPRLRKWKKITRSPSQIAAFGPSSPIQKMLCATRRSRSGSKSPVTKSSPNKVNFGSPSVVKLSDGGKRQSLVSPELLDRSKICALNLTSWSKKKFGSLSKKIAEKLKEINLIIEGNQDSNTMN